MRPAILVCGLLWASGAAAQEYVMSVFAGGASPAAPLTGFNLPIQYPQGIAVDAAGNLYFTAMNCVFRQDPGGGLTRIAGTTRAGHSGDGGPGTGAQLNLDGGSFGRTGGAIAPAGVAIDAAGNLWIADAGNHRIRRVSPDGIITTVAGNGIEGFSGDGGPATEAQLSYPSGVAVDAQGNLFIADTGNLRVREVTADGSITTVAGNGSRNYFTAEGDGAAATEAQLDLPTSVATDAAGNLYISESGGNHIRRVTADGIITTLAGTVNVTGACNTSGDGGPAASAQVCDPAGVTVDAAGNVFFADTVGDFDGDFRQVVRKVSGNGMISTVAGINCFDFCPSYDFNDGLATQAFLTGALGLAVDAAGDLLISDPLSSRIKSVSPDGTIRTVAGGGAPAPANDGVPATSTNLVFPTGVAADAAGDVFIADPFANRIQKVTPGGIIGTVTGGGRYDYSGDGPAGSAEISGPFALAVDGAGNLFFTDGISRVRKLSPDGMISTVAGYGGYGDSGDGGPAIFAAFPGVSGLAADGRGNLNVLEGGTGKIRRIGPDGIIYQVALAPDAAAIAADRDGNLYVAEPSRVWKLSLDSVITTVAGNGEGGFSGDGGPATSAQIAYPAAVAVDATGTVFIADCAGGGGGCRIRRVSPDGIITSIAGDGTWGSGGDGGPGTSASITTPMGLAVDGSGRVYFSDALANVVRVLLPAGR